MADNDYPFMRMGQPIILDVAPAAASYDFPTGYFEAGGPADGANSFLFINPNNFWVRFVGSVGTFVAATNTTGFLFPPGFFGVFTTRFNPDNQPKHLSVMSVTYQNLTASTGKCEVHYGGGA